MAKDKPKKFSVAGLDLPSPWQNTPDFSDLTLGWKFTPLSALTTPAKPRASHWGFWKGEHGAWLEFKGITSETDARFLSSADHFGEQPSIEIIGTAIQQKVQGYAVRSGENLKIHLWLVSKQHWIDLDLNLEHPYHTHLKGTARNPEGEEIPVDLTLEAPNITGTWIEAGGTSLSFSRGSLQWNKDEQEVKGEAWGTIFGRYGEGTFEFSTPARAFVTLRATDNLFRQWCKEERLHGWDRMEDWQLEHNYKERYQANCPQEGWWGSTGLLMHFDVSIDHRVLDGKVSPILHEYKREAPLHLTYVPPSETASTKKSLL